MKNKNKAINIVQEALKLYNFDQEILAVKIGVHRTTINRWANGIYKPRSDQVLLLIDLLNEKNRGKK